MAVVASNSTLKFNAAIATSWTRTQLANTGTRTVWLRAKKTNTAEIYIGDVTVTSAPGGNIVMDLQPGEGIFFDITNPSLLYAVSAAAQTLYVAGME
jgi:hypothetical protein